MSAALQSALAALRAWYGADTQANRAHLYSACMDLFDDPETADEPRECPSCGGTQAHTSGCPLWPANTAIGTALFHRMMAFDQGDPERNALMREVWEPTPWMVDAYTGRCAEARDLQIRRWCFDELGQQSSPIHGRSGTWMRGSATINGWTWFGFATEADMQRFLATWPTPDGITHPDHVQPAPIGATESEHNQ